MRKTYKKLQGFTLIELTVSVVISALLLGGMFYFLTDTLTTVTRSTTNTEFLNEIYNVRDVFGAGEMSLLHDYSSGSGSDIVLIQNGSTGVMFGAVNSDSQTLVSSGQTLFFSENYLGYRDLSATEISDIEADPSVVFGYSFFPDKIIPNIYIKEIQVTSYNSGALHDIGFTFFPNYTSNLDGKLWSTLPEDELFRYNITY